MSIEIINLSISKHNGVSTYDATFSVDGELHPLRVSEEDRSETFNLVKQLVKTPNPDMEELGMKLYEVMSPVANVKKRIESDFYLSESMSVENGVIKFGEYVLEETLSNHILSLLDDNNTPKDGKLWKSYVRFLDNLHQNVNEDIRKQLFRWMDYENKAGNDFGITEDGCIVGYKGCVGTVLQPMSQFTGNAIVDGVEVKGSIPNKVGSVIQMPRSAVEFDPSVGCSVGLHVGTRDYAVGWAPILLLVKVNPRDIVSVPYEVQSQKMRVCEYTVLEVTDASAEHRRFYPDEEDFDNLEYEESYVEFDEDFVMGLDEAYDLQGELVNVEYDDGNKVFEGVLSEVYDDLNNPGIIMRNEDDEYKHIKLHRISYFTDDFGVQDDEDFTHIEAEEEDYSYIAPEQIEESWEDIKDVFQGLVGEEVKLTYKDKNGGPHKVVQGEVTSFYDNSSNPGLIIETAYNGVKHIKLSRLVDNVEVYKKFPDFSETKAKIDSFVSDIEDLINSALED